MEPVPALAEAARATSIGTQVDSVHAGGATIATGGGPVGSVHHVIDHDFNGVAAMDLGGGWTPYGALRVRAYGAYSMCGGDYLMASSPWASSTEDLV
eukprot:gene6291-7542_t